MTRLADLQSALAAGSPRLFARRPWLRRAAVAVLLRQGAGGLELLLVRRAAFPGDRWSGHLAFPGGLEQPGDADAWATAARETSEEAGPALIAASRRVGALSELVTARHGSLAPLVVAPLVFAVSEPVELRLGPELAEAHWVPLAELARARAQKSRLGRALGWFRSAHGVAVGGTMLWGLTLAFVDELLAVLNKSDFSLDGKISRT